MSYIRASRPLAVGVQPVFIGWLDQWIYEDDPVSAVQTPLEAADVTEIYFSLFTTRKIVTGFTSSEMVYHPVEEYQNVPIGNDRIKPVFQFDNEFFSKMGIVPMKANFIYIPENLPPLFAEPAHYIARFDLEIGSKTYPFVIELTIF